MCASKSIAVTAGHDLLVLLSAAATLAKLILDERYQNKSTCFNNIQSAYCAKQQTCIMCKAADLGL